MRHNAHCILLVVLALSLCASLTQLLPDNHDEHQRSVVMELISALWLLA